MPTEIVPVPSSTEEITPPTTTLFGTDDPAAFIARATAAATALKQIVDDKKLYADINGRQFPTVEAWTLIGSMVGVYPVVVWTRELVENGVGIGWEARVEARTRAGEIVGAAEAECRRSERSWRTRDSYALRSMAQTRAVSKALRGPLDFILKMGGYATTPAEEMTAPAPKAPRKKTTPNPFAAEIRRLGPKIDKYLVAEILKDCGITPQDLAESDWAEQIDPARAEAVVSAFRDAVHAENA